MSPEKQRLAIAEACGMEPYFQMIDGVLYDAEMDAVPDYLNDLNAMHEAEKVLTDFQYEEYADMLYDLVAEVEDRGVDENGCDLSRVRRESAKASQRARAFLFVKGKWEES